MAVKKKVAKKKSKQINPHTPAKVAKLKEAGAAEVAVADPKTLGVKAKKGTKEEELRLKQVLQNPAVKVELGEQKIPLDPDPISATIHDGLMDYPVMGTHLRLLCMVDPTQTPTLAQRVAMAKRLNDVGPFLPRYIKSVSYLPGKGVSDEDIAASKSEGKGLDVKAEKAEFGIGDDHNPKDDTPKSESGRNVSQRAARATVKAAAADALVGGIPLKKICAEVDIDPKDARRCLRAKKIEKPGGRWEWTKERAEEIKVILRKERDDIARAKL